MTFKRTHRRLHLHIALALALMAVVLRALIPVGWMPSETAEAPLVICTGAGPAMAVGEHGKGHPVDLKHKDVCPFAASAQLGQGAAGPSTPPACRRGRSTRPR